MRMTDQEWSTIKIMVSQWSSKGFGFTQSIRKAGLTEKEYYSLSEDEQIELQQAWLYPPEDQD